MFLVAVYSSSDINHGDQMKEKEMIGLCFKQRENNYYRILVGKLKGRNYLGDTSIDFRIIFKWILKVGYTCEHLNHLVEDRDKLRAHVHIIMNRDVP